MAPSVARTSSSLLTVGTTMPARRSVGCGSRRACPPFSSRSMSVVVDAVEMSSMRARSIGRTM